MIEIKCNKCGRKYAVDEKKIVRRNTKLKCKVCENIIHVNNLRIEQPSVTPKAVSKVSIAPRKVKTPPPQNQAEMQIKQIFPQFEKEKARHGLFRKYLIAMLLISILPLAAFWKFSFLQATKQIENNTNQFMSLMAQDLGNQVNHWIENNIQALKSVTGSPAVISMHHLNQAPVFEKLKKNNPSISQLISIRLDGINTYRVGDQPLINYSSHRFFKDIVSGKELSWQTQLNDTRNEQELILAVPILSRNHPVGILMAIFNTADMSAHIQNLRKGETGFAFLLDSKNRILAHPMEGYKTEMDISENPLISAFQKSMETTGTFQYNDQNIDYIGHVKKIKFGWSIAVVQEEDEAFFLLHEAKISAVLIIIITVIITIFTAFLCAKMIIRPIKKLTEAAESISLGDLRKQINVSPKDEIGLLSLAVRRMQTSLRMAVLKLQQKS